MSIRPVHSIDPCCRSPLGPRIRPSVGRWLGASAIALIAALSGGCGPQVLDPEIAGQTPAPPPIEVFAARVERTRLASPVVGTGTIAAHMTTDLKPAVSGVVDEVFVSVGDRVEEGQPLLRLRTSEYELRARQLSQNLRLAQAELRDAERVLATNADLAERGAVSRDALEDVRTRREVSAARLGVAEAQHAQARQDLDDATVRAPFKGVITERNVSAGAYIESRMGGGGMMGSPPPLQVQKIDIVAAIVFLPEDALGRIAVGTPARVRVDGVPGDFESQVHVINDRVDYETRTVEVRLGVANEDYRIKPGLFARVEIYPPAREAVLAPRAALQGSRENRHVYIARGGRAVRQAVTVRELDTDRVEILTGLIGGETVLLGPAVARLVDGAGIAIREAPATVQRVL